MSCCHLHPRATERAPQWLHSPDDSKGGQLLQVEGEVEAEAGLEQRRDRLWGGQRGSAGPGGGMPVPPTPPEVPSSLFQTARTRKMKALKVAAKKPRQ